jgi:hypothetical protein
VQGAPHAVGQIIEDRPAVPPRGDEPALAKRREVVGNEALLGAEGRTDLAYGRGPVEETEHGAKPIRLPERAEEIRLPLRVVDGMAMGHPGTLSQEPPPVETGVASRRAVP